MPKPQLSALNLPKPQTLNSEPSALNPLKPQPSTPSPKPSKTPNPEPETQISVRVLDSTLYAQNTPEVQTSIRYGTSSSTWCDYPSRRAGISRGCRIPVVTPFERYTCCVLLSSVTSVGGTRQISCCYCPTFRSSICFLGARFESRSLHTIFKKSWDQGWERKAQVMSSTNLSPSLGFRV